MLHADRAQALASTTGKSGAQIKADYDAEGDLGIVAGKARRSQRTMFQTKPLTLRAVFKRGPSRNSAGPLCHVHAPVCACGSLWALQSAAPPIKCDATEAAGDGAALFGRDVSAKQQWSSAIAVRHNVTLPASMATACSQLFGFNHAQGLPRDRGHEREQVAGQEDLAHHQAARVQPRPGAGVHHARAAGAAGGPLISPRRVFEGRWKYMRCRSPLHQLLLAPSQCYMLAIMHLASLYREHLAQVSVAFVRPEVHP